MKALRSGMARNFAAVSRSNLQQIGLGSKDPGWALNCVSDDGMVANGQDP